MNAFVQKLAPWIIVLGAIPTIIYFAKKLADPASR
jgi:hypothetical protein